MNYLFNSTAIPVCDPNGGAGTWINCVRPYEPGGYFSSHSPGGSYYDSGGNSGGQIVKADGVIVPYDSPLAITTTNAIIIGGRTYTASQLALGLGGAAIAVLFLPGAWKWLAVPALGVAALSQHW